MRTSKYIILTLLLTMGVLVSNCYAQVSWHKYSYFTNYGGLNDNLSSTEIADNEATDIQNVIFDTGGAIKKRFGYNTIPVNPLKVSTGTTVAVNGLSFFKLDDGTRYLVAITNNDSKATVMEKAYQAGGGPTTGAWVNIDNASLNSSYTNNYQPSFAIAQNVLVFSEGTGTSNLWKWTGSASTKVAPLTTLAKQATGSIVSYHKNQLFVAGDTNNLSRIQFSNLDDIYTYTPTDFFDLETSDGSQVRALLSAFDSLYIFKDKSIWRLTGTNRDDFVLQKMVNGIGTLSSASPKVVNNIIYFVTQQGDVAIYDGGYNVQFISQKIRGTIGNLAFNRSTNTVGLGFSTYRYSDNDYYVSVSNSGSASNNLILLFDTLFKAWTKLYGINANCMVVGDDANGQNAIYFGDYSGYVHQYPSTNYYDGNVATSAINAYYQTKWFRYPEVALGDKYWRLLKTYCNSESSTIYLMAEVKSDFESSGAVSQINLFGNSAQWDVAQWDVDVWGGQQIIVGRTEVDKGTNMFQIKYSNSTVNQGFTIVGWETFIEGSDRI